MSKEFKFSSQTKNIIELIEKYKKQRDDAREGWIAEEQQNEHCTQYQEQCRAEWCCYEDMIDDLDQLLRVQTEIDRNNYINKELNNYKKGLKALEAIDDLGTNFDLFHNNEGLDNVNEWDREKRVFEFKVIIDTINTVNDLYDGNVLDTLYRVYHKIDCNEERKYYKQKYLYELNSRLFNIESPLIYDEEFKEHFKKLENEYRKLNPKLIIACYYPYLQIKNKNEDIEVKKFNNIFKYDNGEVLDKHRTDSVGAERTYKVKDILLDKHLYSDGWEYTVKKFRSECCWVTGERSFQIYIHTIKQSKFKGNAFYMDVKRGRIRCLNNVREIQGQSNYQDYLKYQGKILPVAIGD